MIIKSITARNISIPLRRPIHNPAFTFKECKYTLVTVRTECGIEGWSFAFGLHQAKAAVEELAATLVGRRIDTRRLYHMMLNAQVTRWDRGGISMRAVSAIDIALWDIVGKSCGLPIYKMLGQYREKTPVYYSGGHYPTDSDKTADMLAYLEKDLVPTIERGFRSFKIKIGRGRVQQDLERIALCRELIGPDCQLMLDAFCAYDPDTIIPMARKFEKHDITFLEEPVPLDDIPGCAHVAANVSMPVAMGESHYTMAQFRDIINSRAARILQPDVAYVGGITGFIQYAGIAAFHGLKLAPHWCHDLSVQLALSIPEVMGLEYMDEDSALFLIQKVIANPVKAKDGFVEAPEGPGHGLILDEKAVASYLVG